MIRKLLKFVKKYEEYNGTPDAEDFGPATKLLENIKRVGMVCNQLHGLEKAVKDEEATIDGSSVDVDDGSRYEEERLEAAKQKAAQLGIKVVAG
jgi:hypothetical protein